MTLILRKVMTSSKPFSPLKPSSTSALLLVALGVITPAVPSHAIAALSVPDASVSLDPAPPVVVAPVAPAAPLQVESAEVFVDKTDYSLGATKTIDPETALAGGGFDRVNVQIESRQAVPPIAAFSREPEATQVSLGSNFGSVQLSSEGLGWSPSNDAPGEQSVIPASISYLNRKLLRPFSRVGEQNLKLIFPLAIPAPITSFFGWRMHPITGDARMHSGTDIGAPMGTPVIAALAGRVLLSDFLGGYGMAIALEHSDGTQQTLYGHLSEIFVKPGEMIQKGAVIGRVGSTGNSTGPHLHFELRQLTDAGWMAMDAGQQLETTMGDLANALKVAQPSQLALQPGALKTDALKVNVLKTDALKTVNPKIAPFVPSIEVPQRLKMVQSTQALPSAPIKP